MGVYNTTQIGTSPISVRPYTYDSMKITKYILAGVHGYRDACTLKTA